MRKLIAIAALFIASTGFAAGNLSLDIHGANAGYDLAVGTTDAHMVLGSIWNMGRAHGRVTLDKAGEEWSGRFGMVQIRTFDHSVDAQGRRHFSVSVLPGGFHNYTVRTDRRGNYVVTGTNSRHDLVSALVKADGSEFSTGSENTSLSVRRASGGAFEGSRHIWGQLGFPDQHDSVSLNAGDRSEPSLLAQDDAALFVLLYVLPFNL